MKNQISKLLILILLTLPAALMAQVIEPQAGDTTWYKTLIPEEKQGLLKNMSMIANTRFAFRNEFQDGEFTGSRFMMEQFRLEIKGQIHDKVYFRFRDRYTRAQTSESLDNFSRSTDLAFIRVEVAPKWNISLGKMCADWGAFEFDYNPIDIYEYSDIIEYADNFLTGVGVSYTASAKNQFTFQVLDSRTKKFEDLYGVQPNFEEGKMPLALIANWRGSLFDGKFNTIWSYAFHNEARNTKLDEPAGMNYIALGNQLKMGKFTAEYDFKWSQEDLDRSGIISEQVNGSSDYAYAMENTVYIGHWLHLYYRVNPKINLALIGMADVANWKDEQGKSLPGYDEHFRTAYGIIPTFEYFPFKDLNIKFYANFIGRSYVYSDFVKSTIDVHDYNTGRFAIGFVSPLGIF
jgi:hypothetical protein